MGWECGCFFPFPIESTHGNQRGRIILSWRGSRHSRIRSLNYLWRKIRILSSQSILQAFPGSQIVGMEKLQRTQSERARKKGRDCRDFFMMSAPYLVFPQDLGAWNRLSILFHHPSLLVWRVWDCGRAILSSFCFAFFISHYINLRIFFVFDRQALSMMYKILDGLGPIPVPNYVYQKARVTRSFHLKCFINLGELK